jgi:hypothetical protein
MLRILSQLTTGQSKEQNITHSWDQVKHILEVDFNRRRQEKKYTTSRNLNSCNAVRREIKGKWNLNDGEEKLYSMLTYTGHCPQKKVLWKHIMLLENICTVLYIACT